MQISTTAPITSEEWAWVQALIHDVRHEERREAFARELFQWELAVGKFRQLEERWLLHSSPTEDGLHNHAACLHGLLAIGHRLVLAAAGFSTDELGRIGATLERVTATVEDLQISLREWHSSCSPAEISTAQEAIFGAQT